MTGAAAVSGESTCPLLSPPPSRTVHLVAAPATPDALGALAEDSELLEQIDLAGTSDLLKRAD